MEQDARSTLKNLSLTFRHLLEGETDTAGNPVAGDLESRLNQMGVWRDRVIPADEIQLGEADRKARRVVDAYIKYRDDTGVGLSEAVEEYIQESAYTWFNRLFALRCMEARGILVDLVILQEEAYGWRSLKHRRLSERHPELCIGEDEGLYTLLFQEFRELSGELPDVFNPDSPAVALKPSVAAIKRMIALLSGREPVNGDYASDEVFLTADAFGWAYQYWNTEEKDRVFERVRVEKAKISGKDIIPATCLYTEPYMVEFLVQNSLGAQWMCMHPESGLLEGWEYYVRDADRPPLDVKPVREITFLDPACGSGHFLLEAFDLYYDMYMEEGELTDAEDICAAILENNLHGIDIDERAIQIATVSLWMKAKEKASGLDTSELSGFHGHLVAANVRLPRGRNHLEEFLEKHPEDRPLRKALESIFEALENVDEIGSLLKIEEPLERAFEGLRVAFGEQRTLWDRRIQEKDNWKEDVLDQLKTHFNEEAESADYSQAFFGKSANKGLLILDLLSQQYDLVSTNPPYMGAGNMGPLLKKYTERHYHSGKRDLYTAFILQCLQRTRQNGRIAMVTRQSWMFLRYFKNLRLVKTLTGNNKGLVVDVSFEIISQLGAGAFKEISGEVVSVVLFVVAQFKPLEEHRIHASRLVSFSETDEKDQALRQMTTFDPRVPVYRPLQIRFINLPESPFLFWLTEGLWTLFEKSERLEKYAEALEGIQTGENLRWIKYFWEVRGVEYNYEWVCLLKGGGYQKWAGLDYTAVRWSENGKLLDSAPGSILRNSDKYFKSGLSYTDFASGCLGVRFLQGDEVFDLGAPSVFPINTRIWSIFGLACILNSRIASYLIRLLSPNPQHIRTGYLRLLPIPFQPPQDSIENYVSSSLNFRKKIENKYNILSRNFSPENVLIKEILRLRIIELGLAIFDGHCERLAFESYNLNDSDIKVILDELGTPVSWLPLIQRYHSLPEELIRCTTGKIDFHQMTQSFEILTLSSVTLDSIISYLQILYEDRSNKKSAVSARFMEKKVKENDTSLSAIYNPLPTETFLEDLSVRLGIHPISVYWMLKEGIEEKGWRCLPEERRITEDQFTVMILRLLGHRWPTQIEDAEPVPDWADPDGIIPLTENTAEPTLLQRIRQRIDEDFEADSLTVEHEFEELMGKPLEEWLLYEFFKHHTSQFKKRPPVWQIQSTSPGGRGRGRTQRTPPAFSCLVYCQKLDGDTLPKIRSQYVGSLLNSYRTEHRTLDEYGNLSPDQAERRARLQIMVEELEDFDKRLEQVINEGFVSPKLREVVGDEPLDRWGSIDGMASPPSSVEELHVQEGMYVPDVNDGVRVNVAPLQKAGLLASDVIAKKDVDRAINDRAEWRVDERRWCREGKLPQPRYWKMKGVDRS